MNLQYCDTIKEYLLPKISDLFPKDADINIYPDSKSGSDKVILSYKEPLPYSSKPLEVKNRSVKILFTAGLISEYLNPKTKGKGFDEKRMIYDIRNYIRTELEKNAIEIEVSCKNLGFPY